MRIYLDPGHACPPKDRGAAGYLNEEAVVRAVADSLAPKLIALGHEVRVTKPTDGSTVTASLSQRCAQANAWATDLFISLHCNAHKTTSNPMGTEVFAASTRGAAWAQRVHGALTNLGFKQRGVKDGSGLYVIKYTQAPAILVELFFIDSAADCALYTSLGAARVADAIASVFAPTTTPQAQQVLGIGGAETQIQLTKPLSAAQTNMSTKPEVIRPTYLADASKYDQGLEHQTEAWDWLQQQLTPEVLAGFRARFSPSTPPTSKAAVESTVRPWDPKQIDWSDTNCKVSKYFTVGEVTKGDPNRVPRVGSKEEAAILKLALELDKLREAWGSPIGVTSWYRPPAVNAAVGGARYSQHITGGAADIYPLDGSDMHKFQDWVDANWFGALGLAAHKGFQHLDQRNNKGFRTGGEKGPRWTY